jgi:hypothetical protein
MCSDPTYPMKVLPMGKEALDGQAEGSGCLSLSTRGHHLA